VISFLIFQHLPTHQNKVSVSDLSSNRPYHIEFEKLSRSIFTPITDRNPFRQNGFMKERADNIKMRD
jgi:hypothetical protein